MIRSEVPRPEPGVFWSSGHPVRYRIALKIPSGSCGPDDDSGCQTTARPRPAAPTGSEPRSPVTTSRSHGGAGHSDRGS
eukprot:254282-Hanusia_phi.AAC.1